MAERPAVLDEARREVDARLDRAAERIRGETPGRLGEALAYALRSPGKRVRPALVLAAYRATGGSDPAVGGIAAAVEIVHTYSLVHDDLPCMDDDALRRGRPTSHVAFDVPTATRVGYLLVPVAAEELARAGEEMGLDAATVGRLASELFEAGGIRGMVGGQWRDLEAEGRRLDLAGLQEVHGGKTGALIAASVVLGGIAAGAPPDRLEALRAFGTEIGLSFQVADDVLDATRTSEQLGKTAGKDAEVAKSTYVGLLGVSAAAEAARRHADRGVRALEVAGLADGALAPLARYIVDRTS
ncbi:MAG: polyprenyl synthetase family protein [Gemmatimonadales bacterium]|nr:polyprenyl synthetase family protein [Gemmatimonadales bacterium]MCB9517414.1 polyprenyl synthetase family protein [Gemmatimonadales bacterium]